MWKKKLLVILWDATALGKSEWEQLTGRSCSPGAQKYKPVFARQTNNVLHLSQAGWHISKTTAKCHLQRHRGTYLYPQNPCMLQICLRRALQLAGRGLQCALPVHSWNAVALFQKRIFRGASGSISANWKGGCKNAMPCHIYGSGWDITFNMHLNIYGSFLQVVSTQWEERNEGMAVLWQFRVWVYSHETWQRGEGCASVWGSVCVCLPVCLLERGSRAAVGSIAAGPSTVTPGARFRVALHWPLV